MSKQQITWHGVTFSERGGKPYIQRNGEVQARPATIFHDEETTLNWGAEPTSAWWFRAAQTWRRLAKKMAAAGLANWAALAVDCARGQQGHARRVRNDEMAEALA